MAAAVSTFGTVNRAPLMSLNGSGAGAAVPSSTFMGKKVSSRFIIPKVSSGSFKIVAVKEVNEEKKNHQRQMEGAWLRYFR